MHEHVVSFDLNSLYPSLIMQYNMSPETIIDGKVNPAVTVDSMLSRTIHTSKEDNECVAAGGQFFRTDKKGILPTIIEGMYNERVNIKRAMLNAQAELQKVNKDDKQELYRIERDIAINENQQMAIKLLLNSLYGALGNRYFRFFDQRVAEAITLSEQPEDAQSPVFPNLDGVKFLTHGLGCGETRGISNELCGLLAGYACNPNVAGITVLSLGCQHAQVSILEKEISQRSPTFNKPLLVFEQQKYPSEREMMEQAIRQTFAGLAQANRLKRTPAPLSKLCLGMECGASDGFSGISANPAIGRVADLTVALGGKVILSEFPELCGVEQEIVNRCIDRKTGDRFIEIMRNYEKRVKEAGSGFHMNPSPGNVKDGLVTDAIKSAGAARKGGTSPIVDALDYPGWVTKEGLSLLCTAGNDVESTTAMAGAGANLMLFSTGLGTPTGNPISPVIKISSNSKTAEAFKEYIDFDTGSIIDGSESVESLGEKLLDEVIAYASGIKKTKADLQGRDDFLPWKRGMSL